MAIKKITSFIPAEIRLGVGVAVAGGLFYYVYKYLNKSDKEKQEEQLKDESKTVKDPDTGVTVNCQGKLSYPLSWYTAQAEILYKAFFVAFGTDEAGVFGVFNKLKNDCDLAQLFAQFGVRRQEFYFTSKFDLRWFIYDELDKDEVAEVNRILRTKGIKYQF
jgi:hypothetical protein